MNSALRIYVWERRFLMQAGSLVLGRRAKPHKRLSATVLIANKKPFVMEFVGQTAREYQGIIIGPNVPRSFFEALDSDLTIIDAGITTLAYQALKPCLEQSPVRVLRAAEVRRVQSLLETTFNTEMTCADANRIFDEVIRELGTAPAQDPERDPRVQQVMDIVEQLPLDELSLPMLARAAGLSQSRLRTLFQENLGCGPAQYMRWANAWKAIRLWKKGMTFTDVAHEMGFHDLAHIDHAVSELFGSSMSAVSIAQGVCFNKCES